MRAHSLVNGSACGKSEINDTLPGAACTMVSAFEPACAFGVDCERRCIFLSFFSSLSFLSYVGSKKKINQKSKSKKMRRRKKNATLCKIFLRKLHEKFLRKIHLATKGIMQQRKLKNIIYFN